MDCDKHHPPWWEIKSLHIIQSLNVCTTQTKHEIESKRDWYTTRRVGVVSRLFSHHQKICLKPNRWCQGYIYVKRVYQSTLQKIRHYLIFENKVNKNYVLSYCEALRDMQIYMLNIIKSNEKLFSIMSNLEIHYYTRFPKSGTTHRKQVVNLQYQTPQG